jgi:hypothetical protein
MELQELPPLTSPAARGYNAATPPVAVRDLVTHQRPELLDLCVAFRIGGEAHAVRKHRRAPLAQVQAARVHLAEMPEQLGLEGVAAPDQDMQTRQGLIVGKARERSCNETTSSEPMG